MSVHRYAILALALVSAAGAARAADLVVDQNDLGCNAAGPVYCTISDAVAAAGDGDRVLVEPGAYGENVVIDSDIALLSTRGRALTVISGISGVGSLGSVVVTGGTSGVQIGDAGQGFTVNGIDNGNPAIENAALYFQGGHSGGRIRGNKIVAAGDHGLLTEFAATISDFRIAGNVFAGKTFLGDSPAGCGFSQQFSLPNVPRQLVVMGGGAGGGNTSEVTFEDNAITGTAGGPNAACGALSPSFEQGNTLVTVDAAGARIQDNRFEGTTARFGTSLRARGPDSRIRRNDFDSRGQTPTACYVFLQETGERLKRVASRNDFDRPTALLPDGNATTGSICVGSDGGDDDDDDGDDDD
ncbi:MAG: hypothetical protein QNJ30_25670 [Kiloniellales bacterium]|nr:hypothetical protein [Kiloniellales bacterium]